MKRLLRLTPLVAFTSLDDLEVRATVAETFDAAIAGLEGRPVTLPRRAQLAPPLPSAEVVHEETPALSSRLGVSGASERGPDFDLVAQATLDIAGRLGRVTNTALREVASITSDEAREVFSELMDRGALVRRGVRRGTYYILAEAAEQHVASSTPPPASEDGLPEARPIADNAGPLTPDHQPLPPRQTPERRPGLVTPASPPNSTNGELEAALISEVDELLRGDDASTSTERPDDSALRRLLRRRPR